MIIDCHAHFVPQTLLDAIRDRRSEFPSIALEDREGALTFSFAGGAPTRPIMSALSDQSARLAWMDAQGIDRQVVGSWLDIFGYELPPDEGSAWARMINDHFVELARSDDRFAPLGTVPLQDGLKAADELRAVHERGLGGVMIGTQPKGRGGVLDDPGLDPFWEAADRQGALVFVHPVFDSGDDRVGDYGMANAVGRITDTLIAVSRLIFAGHVTRYPNMKLLIGTGGAALPYVIGRLRTNYRLAPDTLADPDEALRGMYYDTIVQDPRALRLLVDTVGADRVMMGSDMPFPIGDPTPLKLISEFGFSKAERASVNGGLIARLMEL